MRRVITRSDILKVLGKDSWITNHIAAIAMGLLGFSRINRLYSPSADLKGQKFTEHMLRMYNITYDTNLTELSSIPKEGGFIVVSNHPFGAIEGIILYDAVAKLRPDFKVMANFILSRIPNLKDVFLPVNPFTDNPEWQSSLTGIKGAMQHLSENKGLGIFPAGEVSRYHGHKYPEDIPWIPSMAKMIKKSGLPVIPVFFEGRNSCKFYTLAKIHSLLATARLPREVLNKQNKNIVFKVGKPISPSEIEQYTDYVELAAYLRSRSYALEANIPDGVPRYRNTTPEPIDPPLRTSAMIQELDKIRDKDLLFTCSSYECFFADYENIPTLMHELGRRREEAFRAIGEGCGKKIDTDQYDCYYKHLILWDTKEQKLAGGYRLGIGKDIIAKQGINGFYISSLFEISESLTDRLNDTIELGRSFVTVDYQKDILPLMLLLKGLMMVAVRYKNAKYFIGPVSISSWYPKFYQSLMVYYVTQNHSIEGLDGRVKPRKPFNMDFMKVDIKALMDKNMESVDKFDRYMIKLSNGDYRMPTLFKKYLKMQAKFLCFNLDPDFNDTLDGLLMLEFDKMPDNELLMLMKDSTEEEKKQLFQRFHHTL